MPVNIEKNGDLVGCRHNGTTKKRRTRKDRATQPMDHGRLRCAINSTKHSNRRGRIKGFFNNLKKRRIGITVGHPYVIFHDILKKSYLHFFGIDQGMAWKFCYYRYLTN